MTQFTSKTTKITAKDSEVFNFLSDFRNLKGLMPPQVVNWEASKDTCSFTVQGLASLEMKMESNTPLSNVHVVSFGNNPVEYTLDYNIAIFDSENCTVVVEFNADLNPFVKMVASKPLQNLVDMMTHKLQEVFLKN